MKTIQGFVAINEYVNNTPGSTAILGELSTWSRTYSTEQGEYQDPQVPGLQLITMRCVNEATQATAAVSTQQVREILELVKTVIIYAKAHTRPYDPRDFRASILTAFYNRISGLIVGEFVDNGSIALPQFLSWKSETEDGNEIKVWLCDSAFADQYADYRITVVPPVEDVSVLVGSFTTAKLAALAQTPMKIAQAVQAAKDGHPETYYRIMSFTLVNRFNPSETVDVHFSVLIYGKAGDNTDAIRDAIVEYIANHSTVQSATWEAVLPELFKRTEFVILPRWDKLAVTNQTTISGVYSSVVTAQDAIAHATQTVSFYNVAHIEHNVCIVPHTFKCLALEIIPGETNLDGKKTFTELYPDYIPVSSTSADFSRMKPVTRDWVLFIDDLIIQAETATPTTVLPVTMRRLTRAGKLYVTGVHKDIQYLVYARCNNI